MQKQSDKKAQAAKPKDPQKERMKKLEREYREASKAEDKAEERLQSFTNMDKATKPKEYEKAKRERPTMLTFQIQPCTMTLQPKVLGVDR